MQINIFYSLLFQSLWTEPTFQFYTTKIPEPIGKRPRFSHGHVRIQIKITLFEKEVTDENNSILVYYTIHQFQTIRYFL